VWRVFFAAAMGICRVAAILLAVIFVFPLAIGKTILTLVAVGWLPPRATVVAYLLPVFFFGVGVILGFVLIFGETRWSRALFRVLAGDVEERIKQALGHLSGPASLSGEPGGEFAVQSNISQLDIEQTGGPPEKA
jgi:hypothetical protein